jgi:hypothetical protein
MVIADPGVTDKRALIVEPEFVNVLKQTERDSNTLSAIIRQAWDRGNLRTMTKNSPAKATGAHVSIVGHITTEELRRCLNATEMANGFANRFMWFAVRRSKLLPFGGRLRPDDLAPIVNQLRAAADFARRVGEVTYDQPGRELWADIYAQLADDRPGIAGSLLARSEAHVMRLAMIYALLDGSRSIRCDHIIAASALWEYAERSVLYVFGNSTGDPLADDLLRLLKANPNGITRTEISRYLQGNTKAAEVTAALKVLLRANLARFELQESGGPRKVERWFAGRRPA